MDSDSKKIIETLVKIANSQQKIIRKLAQGLPPDSLPNSQFGMGEGHVPSANHPALPTVNKPNVPVKRPAEVIINALGDFFHQNVRQLEVPLGTSEVKVAFKPGRDSDANFNHIVSVVNQLAASGTLPGKTYQVKSVG